MDFTRFVEFITNPQALIAAFGLIGIFIIIFLETGFVFGFFFPGDSLLFTAGLFAAQGYLPVWILGAGIFIASVAGDSVGYGFGKRVGPALFTREDSTFFNKGHIAKAQHFYEKYGVRNIIIARFLPIVRTFAPIVAGIGGMEYKKFLTYNVIGGFIWTVLLVGLGYGFGTIIPDPDRYLWPAILVIVLASALPTLRQLLKKRL